ncbi:MAG: cytidine deaminase [Candidatus Paceibacterota bacterium]|jgi:cytidine deaminase
MNSFIDRDTELLIRNEITKCHAPVTGLFVVCAIFTEKDVYINHNYEFESPVLFEHAEDRVLKKVLKNEKRPVIKKIVMLGAGRVMKFKYYTPCYSCTQIIQPFVTSDTTVHLLPLGETTETLSITFNELVSSYRDMSYSKIENSDIRLLREELEEKTILKDKDLDFVVDLVLLGRKKKIEYYLTGSSTGRGGVSTLIINKTKSSYHDVDIIGIAKCNCEEVENTVEGLLIKHFNQFRKEERFIQKFKDNKNIILKQYFYYCGENGDNIIDLTLSSSFKGSFSYRAYELKNWFHQLS